MPSKVDELVLRVEAVLFAGGKPMSVKELTGALQASDHRPVQAALKKKSTRITARDLNESLTDEDSQPENTSAKAVAINREEFFRS